MSEAAKEGEHNWSRDCGRFPGGPPSTALSDPLIAAMVGKLPAPAPGAYSRAQRINWLKMMVMAFNEAYGVEAPIVVAELGDGETKPLRFTSPPVEIPAPASSAAAAELAPASQRYRVDSQGFALFGETPVDPQDVPIGCVFEDERSAIERGDLSTVLWKTNGAIAADKLPQITLRAA